MGLDARFDCIKADLSKFDKSNRIKIFFYAEAELLQPVYELLAARYGDKINLTFSLAKCLEVMCANTNKGEAVKVVLKSKSLEISDAFGDGMNDIEMLLAVAKPVIMANAQHALKDALPNVEKTLSSKEHSMAVMMERYLA